MEDLGSELIGKLTYYERWIVAFANILLEKGMLTPDQLAKKTAEVEARIQEGVEPSLSSVIPAFERVKELAFGPVCDSLAEDFRRRGMTGKARYLEAKRAQLRWDRVDLESQLASDHRARIVWAFVGAVGLVGAV